MPYAPTRKDTSVAALAELRDATANLERVDPLPLEDELAATAFALDCKRQWDEQDKARQLERRSVEALQGMSSMAAGALSTWHAGSFNAGAWANLALGAVAKVGCILEPEQRALRVLSESVKPMVHVQLGIWVHQALTKEGT